MEFRRLVGQYLSDPMEDLGRPSLSVTVTPSSTAYEVVVTWTGTMVYSIDGAAPTNGTTSPQTFNIARNAFLGAAKVYVFYATNNDQTTSNTVVIPAIATNAAGSLSIPAQTADSGTDDYTYSWTASGQPSGTTYNLRYKYTNTAGTLVEEGVINNATSGGVVNSTGTIGANPTYVMTVDAINAGQVIVTASRTGTFVT